MIHETKETAPLDCVSVPMAFQIPLIVVLCQLPAVPSPPFPAVRASPHWKCVNTQKNKNNIIKCENICNQVQMPGSCQSKSVVTLGDGGPETKGPRDPTRMGQRSLQGQESPGTLPLMGWEGA